MLAPRERDVGKEEEDDDIQHPAVIIRRLNLRLLQNTAAK